jgi:hypothetical protein
VLTRSWQCWFCRVCGSPLPGVNDKSRTFVPAGLISQGGEDLRIAHHIWVGSKAVWDEIGDAGKQHPATFEAWLEPNDASCNQYRT